MNRELLKGDKVRVVYYGKGEDAEIKDKNHWFILAGNKILDPFQITDLLRPANEILKMAGADADPCVTLCSEELFLETGYHYVFEQWIRIDDRTPLELLAADTGDCSLAEAIAIWMLKRLGDALDIADEVASEFAHCCRGIDLILAEAAEKSGTEFPGSCYVEEIESGYQQNETQTMEGLKMSKMRLDYFGLDRMFSSGENFERNYRFGVSADREVDIYRYHDEFCKVHYQLKGLGVYLDLSTEVTADGYYQEMGCDYPVSQRVFIHVKDPSRFEGIKTGHCTLAQAICLWLLMKYGENLEGDEAFKRMYEVNCQALGEFLDQKSEI